MTNHYGSAAQSQVAVLSRQPDSYAVKRFQESANRRGIRLELLDPHQVYVYLLAGRATACCEPQRFDPLALRVIPRLGSTTTEYSLVALDLLERAGAIALNSSIAILRLRNKFTALVQLAQAGLPVPDSAMLRAPSDIAPAVEQLGGYPLVLKFIRGSQGVGVVYAPDESVVTSVLEALNLLQYDVLLQKYYPAAAQADTRVFVLGGEARWAVRRESTGGRFRSNFHRGGSAAPVALEPHLCELAHSAAGTFGLSMAGVDLIEGSAGLLVMEVNSSPGFETIERCYPVDVAGELIDAALALPDSK